MEDKIKEQVIEEVERKPRKKYYEAGNYTCDNAIKVIKKLDFRNKYNKDGSVARTHGVWVKPDNFYYFTPGNKTELTKEDMKNPSIHNLVAQGKIYRTL